MLVTPPLLVGQIWQNRDQRSDFLIKQVTHTNNPQGQIHVRAQLRWAHSVSPDWRNEIGLQYYLGTTVEPAGYPCYYFYPNRYRDDDDLVRLLYCPSWKTE
jgi:hypothetical protein